MAARGRATTVWTGTITSPALRNASRRNTSPAERYHLRAAGSVVGNRNCAVQAARCAGRERYTDGAGRSGCESRTTSVGLPKVRTRGDTCNIERRRAVVAQRDALCWAGCSYNLVAEGQAGR